MRRSSVVAALRRPHGPAAGTATARSAGGRHPSRRRARPSTARGWAMGRLEWLSQKVTNFVGSTGGGLAAFAVLVVCLVVLPLTGDGGVRHYVGDVVVAVNFALLFLLQRSQTKDTLAIQLKLNELLAAV